MHFVTPELFLAPLSWIYGASLIILTIAGLSALVNVVLYLTSRRHITHSSLDAERTNWPAVTVQLPMFNERFMVERLLAAVTRMEYPAGKLHIQVLDDSSDDTTCLVEKAVARYRDLGFNIELIHREERGGYKAGALENGLHTASGELIAIFDADFLPPPDWLKRVVPTFDDPRVGFTQTRWGFTNQHANLLTDLQVLALNQQFVIEHNARLHNGLFMSFNGSGGMWRRACIEDAGGWSADTLVEDLDLSFRAQLAGWKAAYLPDVVVPNDLPEDLEAFKRQQYRWAKGGAQTLRKLGWRLLRSKLPLKVRLAGLIHLSLYLSFPSLMLLFLAAFPLAILGSHVFSLFSWTVIGAVGLPLGFLLAKTEYHPSLIKRALLIPGVLLMGTSLLVNNTAAVIAGLFRRGGEFVRTPKPGAGRKTAAQAGTYKVKASPLVWAELGVTLYACLGLTLMQDRSAGLSLGLWMLGAYASFPLSAVGNLVSSLKQTRHNFGLGRAFPLSPRGHKQ